METYVDNKIDFNLIKGLFGLQNKNSFILYLNKIYPDFCTVDEANQVQGMSKLKFIDFFKLPVYICEKFFYCINKHKSEFISLEQFTNSLCMLYFGSIEEVSDFIFELYDFDHDGKVFPEDVKSILSFLPLKEDKTKVSYKYQLESIEELDIILSKTFKKKEFFTLEDFSEAIKIKSDIFLQMVCYLFQRCPFKEESVKVAASRSPSSSSKTIKLIRSLPLDNILQGGELTLNKHQSQTPRHNTSCSSNFQSTLLSSPSNKTNFSPLRDFLKEALSPRAMTERAERLNRSTKNKLSKSNLGSVKASINLNSALISGMEGMICYSNYKLERKVKTEALNINIKKKLGTRVLAPQRYKEEEIFGSGMGGDDVYIKKLINQCSMGYIEKFGTSTTEIIDFPDEDETEEELTEEEFKKSIQHEGLVSQWSDSKRTLKHFWLVLVKDDIYYYENEIKQQEIKVKNILGCFIKEIGEVVVKGTKFFSFSIIFRNKTRKFLVKTREESKTWTDKLRVALGYKNFFDTYEILDDLGSGSYGAVKLGIYIKTKQKVAIKIIQKSKLKPEELNLVITEIDVLKFCKHPNVVNFLDHFENSEYIFLILEYIKYGDLREYINKKKQDGIFLSEERGAEISKQIAEGINYLHRFGIVHRDLKLENIMISKYEKNKTFEVKILDFGLSKIISPKETSSERYGTLYYISPEIILDHPHNRMTDIWSYGILVYNLLSGEFPFDDSSKSKQVIAKKIAKNPLEFPSVKWKNRSKEVIDLIENCLRKDMNKRISAANIVKHPWFEKFKMK